MKVAWANKYVIGHMCVYLWVDWMNVCLQRIVKWYTTAAFMKWLFEFSRGYRDNDFFTLCTGCLFNSGEKEEDLCFCSPALQKAVSCFLLLELYIPILSILVSYICTHSLVIQFHDITHRSTAISCCVALSSQSASALQPFEETSKKKWSNGSV